MALRKLLLTGAAASAAALSFVSSAHAFGTVNGLLDQRSEHERITRIGLQCVGGAQAPDCFQPASLDNVAGKGKTWGAVGAADNLFMHNASDEDFWHCDNADYLQPSSNGGKKYPQARSKAMDHLRECVRWGRAMLYDGIGTPGATFAPNLPQGTPLWGALGVAGKLLNSDGSAVSSPSGTCTFNGIAVFGNAKCNVLEPWGYVLHMSEDFYSHTNWADRADPSKRLSTTNPPGLGNTDVAPFLDLRRAAEPTDAQIPADFTGGCFTGVTTNWLLCSGHIRHSDDINKDKELIDTATGAASDPISPRSKIIVDGITNGQRAVTVAAKEARRQWAVLRAELIQRFGVTKGATMACALTMDDTGICNTRNIVAVVDTSRTPAPKGGATARAAQADGAFTYTPTAAARHALESTLTPSDRVSVLTFDSANGAQDADPFTAPADATVDDANRGDAADDPVTTDQNATDAPDVSVVTTPDGPGTEPTSPDEVLPHGDHESPNDDGGPQPVTPAQAAPRGADAAPSAPVAPQTPGSGNAPANALASAGALLANQDAPTGQRGVVMLTNRLGDTDALVARIDELAAAGTSVSLVRYGGGVPDQVVAAIENARGTVIALPVGDEIPPADVAASLTGAGLTRLTDPFGADQEATLSGDGAPVTGITDAGVDRHQIAPRDAAATIVARTADDPLTVVVTDARTGRAQRDVTTLGEPAELRLPAGANATLRIEGPSGTKYTAALR